MDMKNMAHISLLTLEEWGLEIGYLCSCVTNLMEEKSRWWNTAPNVYNNFTAWMCLFFQDKPPITYTWQSQEEPYEIYVLWSYPARCPLSPEIICMEFSLAIFFFSQQVWISNFLPPNLLENVVEDREGDGNGICLEWLHGNAFFF